MTVDFREKLAVFPAGTERAEKISGLCWEEEGRDERDGCWKGTGED